MNVDTSSKDYQRQSRHILVLGGGGCRGILQMEILKELEFRGELNDVDLIFGTSVGGINGAMFAVGRSMIDIRNGYKDFVHRVFRKKLLPIPPIYDRQNFISCWNEIIGMKRFKDVKIPLVLSSIDMVTKRSHFFKSYTDPYELLLEMVLRTFSAPYYFGTLTDDVSDRVYGDGGMGEDNLPITESILEAISLGWIGDDIKLTIVGTGFRNIVEKFNKVKNKSTIAEVMDYISPSNGGFARMVSRQKQLGQLVFLAKSFDNFNFNYYDIMIPKRLDKMDNIKAYDEYVKYGYEASKTPLISK